MKLMGGITSLMNMSLSKLWKLVMDREVWCAAPHDIQEVSMIYITSSELMYREKSGSRQKSLGKEEGTVPG